MSTEKRKVGRGHEWLRRRVDEIRRGPGMVLLYEVPDIKEGDVCVCLDDALKAGCVRSGERTIRLGTGRKDEATAMTVEETARLYGKLVALAHPREPGNLVVVLRPEDDLGAVVRGALLSSFVSGEFKSDLEPYTGPSQIVIVAQHLDEAILKLAVPAAERVRQVACLCNLQRWLASLPCQSGYLDISGYGQLIEGCLSRLLRPTAEESRRMELLHAVGGGSDQLPRVVGALIHPASGPTEICNVVVGKGLVYDTGGVQDKGEHMPGMQGDMQGSAAVLAQALYFQNYPERLRKSTLFVMVLAENRDGPSAYLPNNIYPMYNGTTVEVTHTDAEGRLVLADAVGWATELVATSSDRGIKIGTVCTIATLTGAAVNALGPPYSGVMVKDNDPELTARLVLSGNRTGDLVWPLPDHPWYAAKMKSHAADLRNTGTIKQGGAQQGFAFLKRAPSGDVQGLVHLDIAPKLEGSGEDGYTDGLPRDGAVAMMIDFLSAS